jgi:hypothetical protein
MHILKKGNNDMATFYHSNGNIEFKREDAKLWYTNTSFKFLCKMNFKNTLEMNQLELVLNEIDISCLLDSIYQFLDYNMNEIIIPFKQINRNIHFTFYIENFKYYLSINEYNVMNHISISRMKISFKDKDDLLKFCDIIYFVYLIDIDDGTIQEDYLNIL